MTLEYLPLVAALAPFVGVIVVVLAHRVSDGVGDFATAGVCAVSLVAVAALVPTIAAGDTVSLSLDVGFPVPLLFYVDALGLVMGVLSALVWTLASVYSNAYMRHEEHRMRFNAFSLFSLGGMMGLVLTGNLFSLYVFFELMAILSYVLIIHEESGEALRAGLKYLFMGIIGGLVLLAAIVSTYVIAGSVDITGAGISGLAENPWAIAVFWAYIFGFGIKAGMFPVHVWLPDAHPIAPSPASALLSGIMIKAGAYGLIRTVFAVFGWESVLDLGQAPILFALAVITMLFASSVAIAQTEIKRLLAYSSIAQIGYVVLGVSLLTPLGLEGAVLQIVNHAFMKGTLFLAAGAIILMTGVREIKDFGGVGWRMPVTMTCFTISALSMIGFPPLSGFVSKWALALGSVQAGTEGLASTAVAAIGVGALLLSSLLNVVYYGPILTKAWFGSTDEESELAAAETAHARKTVARTDPPWQMTVPMVLLTIGTVVLGVYPRPVQQLAELVVRTYFGGT